MPLESDKTIFEKFEFLPRKRGQFPCNSYFALDISEWPELPRKENTNDKKMIRLQLKLSSTLHYQNFYH